MWPASLGGQACGNTRPGSHKLLAGFITTMRGCCMLHDYLRPYGYLHTNRKTHKHTQHTNTRSIYIQTEHCNITQYYATLRTCNLILHENGETLFILFPFAEGAWDAISEAKTLFRSADIKCSFDTTNQSRGRRIKPNCAVIEDRCGPHAAPSNFYSRMNERETGK